MSRLRGLLMDYPVGVSMTLVAGGLLLGALLGGQLGCYVYTEHMGFLHEGSLPECVDSPLILWGGVTSGALIGAGCSILVLIFIYLRGRCTTFFSLVTASASVAVFSLYAMNQGRPLENFLFTGTFIGLGGFALGATAGAIVDHLKTKKQN